VDERKVLDEVPGPADELCVDESKLLEVLVTVLLCVELPSNEDDDIVAGEDAASDDEVAKGRIDVLTEEDPRSVAGDEAIEEDVPPAELDVATELLNTEDEASEEDDVPLAELDPAMELLNTEDEIIGEDNTTELLNVEDEAIEEEDVSPPRELDPATELLNIEDDAIEEEDPLPAELLDTEDETIEELDDGELLDTTTARACTR